MIAEARDGGGERGGKGEVWLKVAIQKGRGKGRFGRLGTIYPRATPGYSASDRINIKLFYFHISIELMIFIMFITTT